MDLLLHPRVKALGKTLVGTHLPCRWKYKHIEKNSMSHDYVFSGIFMVCYSWPIGKKAGGPWRLHLANKSRVVIAKLVTA